MRLKAMLKSSITYYRFINVLLFLGACRQTWPTKLLRCLTPQESCDKGVLGLQISPQPLPTSNLPLKIFYRVMPLSLERVQRWKICSTNRYVVLFQRSLLYWVITAKTSEALTSSTAATSSVSPLFNLK